MRDLYRGCSSGPGKPSCSFRMPTWALKYPFQNIYWNKTGKLGMPGCITRVCIWSTTQMKTGIYVEVFSILPNGEDIPKETGNNRKGLRIISESLPAAGVGKKPIREIRKMPLGTTLEAGSCM